METTEANAREGRVASPFKHQLWFNKLEVSHLEKESSCSTKLNWEGQMLEKTEQAGSPYKHQFALANKKCINHIEPGKADAGERRPASPYTTDYAFTINSFPDGRKSSIA